MTKQEIFDKVWCGILAQGQPSMDESDRFCMYRGADGRKCAAGHLIDDEHYHRNLELVAVDFGYFNNEVVEALQNSIGTLDNELVVLIRELQIAHDTSSSERAANFVSSFQARAEGVATRFGLNVPA